MSAALPALNRQWRLRQRPIGLPDANTFEMVEAPFEPPVPAQVLVENLMVSFDPAMRGWLADRKSYSPPVQLGEVMRASGVGRVLRSEDPRYPEGALVEGLLGWQEYVAVEPETTRLTVVPEGVSPEQALSVYGITGLTAYFGLLDVGMPKAGQTVVVSGAAGATGSVVGQIAKLKGCHVVGIAGGPRKCEWLTGEAHYDAAIDYKSEDVSKRLRALCPKGIDVFFDNVGGATLEAGISNLAQKARVVICGGISSYNAKVIPPGPRNYLNLIVCRARMEGFLVLDYLDRAAEARKELAKWVDEGLINYAVDVQSGIENIPQTFQRLFSGKSFGKQVLRLRD